MQKNPQESLGRSEENLDLRSSVEENMEVVATPTSWFSLRNRTTHRNGSAPAYRGPEEGNAGSILLDSNKVDPETSASTYVQPFDSSKSPPVDQFLIEKRSLRSRRPFVPFQPSLPIAPYRKHRYSIEQLFRERKKENQVKDRIEHIKQQLVTFDQDCEVAPDENQFKELGFLPIERDLQFVGIFIQLD